VLELPGCFASGKALAELKDAFAEAIGMVLVPNE
jgi:predicted RNase H-like HicB family nuclease